jgi:hypothetical protein
MRERGVFLDYPDFDPLVFLKKICKLLESLHDGFQELFLVFISTCAKNKINKNNNLLWNRLRLLFC